MFTKGVMRGSLDHFCVAEIILVKKDSRLCSEQEARVCSLHDSLGILGLGRASECSRDPESLRCIRSDLSPTILAGLRKKTLPKIS